MLFISGVIVIRENTGLVIAWQDHLVYVGKDRFWLGI